MPPLFFGSEQNTDTTLTPASFGGVDEPVRSSAPSYFIAADSHSIANADKSLLEITGETIANIPKFLAASMVSGGNQLYNIVPSLGNAFGGDYELSDTAEVMQDIDDDLGRYYEEHAGSADTLGFILSSIVPGSAGIKVLNAGQKMMRTAAASGRFGENMSKAYALKASLREKYVAQAIKEITATDNAFRLMDRNLLKAMGAGMGQQVLEAAAFETAVAATMFNSPILDEQDVGDLVANIAFGGVVFGAIGGVVDATRAAFKVKKAVREADAEAMPWRHIQEAPEGATTSDRLLTYYDQIHTMPPVPKAFGAERLSYLQSSAKSKVKTLELKIRNEFTTLAGGDQVIAEQMFQAAKITPPSTVIGNYLGAKGVSRIADISKIEARNTKITAKINAGKDVPLKEVEAALNTKTTYQRNWGDDAGNITDSVIPTRIVDTLKKGDNIEVTRTRVDIVSATGKRTKVAGFKKPTAKKIDSWDVKKSSVREAEARTIWAAKQKLSIGQAIGQGDIPLLEQAYKQFDASYEYRLVDGGVRKFQTPEDLLGFIQQSKLLAATDLAEKSLKKGAKKGEPALSQEEIATMLNVRPKYLSGEVSTNPADDLFAMDTYAAEYTQRLVTAGARKKEAGDIDIWNTPQHTKVLTDTSPVKDLDGMALEGMAQIKQRQHEYLSNTSRASAAVLGEDYEKLIDILDIDILKANRLGAGSGFAAAASANYGTLASKMEFIGNATSGMIRDAKGKVRETFEAPLYKLTQNTDAAIEWSTINATLRSIPENYALNATGDALIPAVIKRYENALAAGKSPKTPELKVKDAPLVIPLKNPEVRELARMHIEVNGANRSKQQVMKTSQGMEHVVDTDTFYPIPVDPKDFPYFATVTDSSITGTGHTKTIYAASERELGQMIKKIENEPGLTIRTKKDAEDYWKSIGQFDYDKTLHENYLDIAMHRKGVSSPYFVATDPQKIANEFLTWHSQRATGVVREAVALKYEKQFAELRSMGETYTNLATSKVGSLSTLKHADEVVENPFMDYVKTSLAIKSYSDYPFWTSANRLIDSKLSQMYARITETVEGAKTSDELLKVNETLREYGYKGAAYDEGMELIANHTAPKGVVSNFIQKANALLATVVLRLDTINAVNNTVGANVLLGAELKAVMRAMERGDVAAVGALGELASLMKVKVPGTDKLMTSPAKLIAESIKKFGRETPEMEFYKKNGFVTSISDQYKWTLDQLTVGGKETAQDFSSKINKVQTSLSNFADKGERWTGNRLAEEFNRFVAADVMKQITDVAVNAGVMDSKTALSYINTFVNRTQGNYLASQRPMMFQGPIGQAIGLFQTYQFNLMQQLLRHVGEGRAKDSATLLGLQGTIYGMNGLPAFNAINTHVIGTASGNEEHKDMYDAVYGAAGKEAGDWMMYGVASNLLYHPDLKINLYVRGDINPRHVTIVPTNPADVPIYGASVKFFSNLFNTADQLIKGGDVSSTLLQGLEHNGISRPLAGIAQTLQGLDNPNHSSYSTSNRGNVIASNDLLSLANMGRMLGGKPLGEAVAVDAAFRLRAYTAKDNERRKELGASIKTTMIAGRVPSQEQIDGFAEDYVKLGGKQTEFNKWMLNQYKNANTSQINQLLDVNSSKFSQSMQTLMGGYELRDFVE